MNEPLANASEIFDIGLFSQIPHLPSFFYSGNTHIAAPLEPLPSGLTAPVLILSLIILLLSFLVFNWLASYHDGIPVVNRRFALEPRIFSRWRWAFNAVSILDDAHQKYHDQPYRLARGDVDVLVFPQQWVPELNKLKESSLNSHKYQCRSITGHFNELDIVLQSNFHMKLMLHRGTLALPALTQPLAVRAQASLREHFPTNPSSWETLDPLPRIAQSISQMMALLLLGDPICDDPALVELSPRLTQKAFSVAFAMRLVPTFLENHLLWLLPMKWTLGRAWRQLDSLVVPELERRRDQDDHHSGFPNVASWMMLEAKRPHEADPKTITRLVGSAFAGGIWSTSTLIFGVIADLVAHPHYLDEIREEIRQKHVEIGGKWDYTALNGLGKLDSAMKETSRLAPGSMLVYGRVLEHDHRLSNGIVLQKGQHIATPLHTAHADATLVPNPAHYNPLRWYQLDPDHGHLKAPFTSLNEIGRWGNGRRACPGRFLASLAAKLLLIQFLDDYDFAFSDRSASRPSTQHMHEFVFLLPSAQLQMRLRPQRLGIEYV